MPESLIVPRSDHASALFTEHGPALRAYIGSKLRNRAYVEDLCQETFVAALDRGVPAEGAGRWLFGIARNKVLKHLRDRKATASLEVEPASTTVAPSDSVSSAESRGRVRDAVAGLEEDLREVILLRYEGGLGYQAIADRLDLPLTTVQGRLKRARVALKKTLIEEGTA